MPQDIYPLDTSNLNKGDVITVDQVRAVAKADPGSSKYAWTLLKLSRFVTRKLAERGLKVTVCSIKGQLRILTDAEAEEYNVRAAKYGKRKIRRAATRHALIDLSNLTPEQRLQWDKNSAKLAMTVGALNSATRPKIPEAKPHKRIG